MCNICLTNPQRGKAKRKRSRERRNTTPGISIAPFTACGRRTAGGGGAFGHRRIRKGCIQGLSESSVGESQGAPYHGALSRAGAKGGPPGAELALSGIGQKRDRRHDDHGGIGHHDVPAPGKGERCARGAAGQGGELGGGRKDIYKIKDHSINTLSGGQQRQAAIARASVN